MSTEPPLPANETDANFDHQTDAAERPRRLAPKPSTRTQLLRDVVIFQIRLAMDGLRDLVLSPVSILAALAGILFSRKDPHKFFRRLMALGQRSDVFINLFNAHSDDAAPDARSTSDYANKFEAILVDELAKSGGASGLTASAKAFVDKLRARRQHSSRQSDNDV